MGNCKMCDWLKSLFTKKCKCGENGCECHEEGTEEKVPSPEAPIMTTEPTVPETPTPEMPASEEPVEKLTLEDQI